MRKFTFILIILLGCSMSNISAQEVIKDMQGTLSGDTYVNGTGGLDNTAMGEHATMKNRIYVKYNNKREGYIKFNISDIAAEVVDKIYVGKAELSVFLYAALTDEAILHSLMAKQSASTWDESTLTYNNRPLPEDAVLCEITLSESQKAANSEVKFDVTQAVKKAVENNEDEVSIVLSQASTAPAQGTDVMFISKERGTGFEKFFPKLNVSLYKDVITGLTENAEDARKVYVSPCPVRKGDMLNIWGVADNASVNITDVSGRIILTSESHSINTGDLAPGIYFLRTAKTSDNAIKFIVR